MTSKRRKMNENNLKEFNSNENHSLMLLKKLNTMRTNEHELCDYEIRVNGESFYCHRCVLIAASDFFKAMLTTCSMKESRQNYVDLKGFHSTYGIKLVLDFIYTGLINLTFENILSVLDSASQLQINYLFNLCCQFLIQNINHLNCVTILKLADTYSIQLVVDKTIHFISENICDIYKNNNQLSDQFNELNYEQIKYLLNNDYLQVGSELDLFLIIVKWLEYSEDDDDDDDDGEERLKYAYDLVKHVRFMNMSAEELADKVEPIKFMQEIPECNLLLMNAYKWYALPKRQPLIQSEQTQLRNQEMLVAIGEHNIFVLNETKQKWEIVTNAPLEDNYPYPFSVITINNYLYVFGTRRTTCSQLQEQEYKLCYRFSPRTLQWTQLAPLLNDRSRFGLALINNDIYIFGGFEGFKRTNRIYLNSIERYSIEHDKWEEFSNDGPLMSCMASTSHDNLIYFGGGKNVNWSKVNDFYSINIESKEIKKKANMLTARTTHQITNVNGLIFVFGGFDEAGNGVLSIESYSIKNDQWTNVTSIPGALSKTWPQSLGYINNKFYISVFTTPNTFKIIQKGYYYDIETNLWSEGPVINERARYCPTCSLAFPKNIYNNNSKNNKIVVSTTTNMVNNNKNNIDKCPNKPMSSSLSVGEYDDEVDNEIIEEINYETIRS